MLYPDATLEESRAMKGRLGAIAFAVLRGLKEGGASADELATTEALMKRCFEALSDHDCDVLVEVVEKRLEEASEHGAWDASEKLAGRLTMPEAHIVHDALQQQGIETEIRHEHLSSGDFPNPNTDVELWVRADDLAQAKELLQQIDTQSAETVACPECGAENPAHFGQCWSCNAVLSREAAAEAPADEPAADDAEG
jgi:lipopolysaccharide biosynthesis regulator YciM